MLSLSIIPDMSWFSPNSTIGNWFSKALLKLTSYESVLKEPWDTHSSKHDFLHSKTHHHLKVYNRFSTIWNLQKLHKILWIKISI